MKKRLYLMMGVPGSGKSTYVKSMLKYGDIYVSRDEIRTTTDGVNLCPSSWDGCAVCCDHCGDMYYYGSNGKYNAYGDWYCNKCVQDGYYSKKRN